MQSRRVKAVLALRREAEALRAWADRHLPEPERFEPYMAAARLESLANELGSEPVWQRVGADVAETTQHVIESASRRLARPRS